jgi:hypothetical protein
MFNTIVEAGAVGAGAASRYGSGSDQKMRLRLCNTGRQYYGSGRFFTGSGYDFRKRPDPDPGPDLHKFLANFFSEIFFFMKICSKVYASKKATISDFGSGREKRHN